MSRTNFAEWLAIRRRLPTTDAGEFAARWLQRRYRVPLYLADLIATHAGLGGVGR